MVNASGAEVSCLIIIGSLISETLVFLFGKLLAGTAPIAEFLLITGGTQAVSAGMAVISRCTGVRVLALMFIAHQNHAPFADVQYVLTEK